MGKACQPTSSVLILHLCNNGFELNKENVLLFFVDKDLQSFAVSTADETASIGSHLYRLPQGQEQM